MGTWEHMEKVNCGNPDITLALCPGVTYSKPTTGSRTIVTDVSAVAKNSTAYAFNFTLYNNLVRQLCLTLGEQVVVGTM